MPFITEEIWGHIGEGLLMLQTYPEYDERMTYAKEEHRFTLVIEAIRAIRAKRAEMNVPPSIKAKLFIETANGDLYRESEQFFGKLAYCSSLTVSEKMPDTDGMVVTLTSDAKFFIPFGDLVDIEKETARLKAKRAKVQKDFDFSNGKLSNPGFTMKAPAAQVEAEREKLRAATEKLAKIEESLKALGA
jgi:valyl-tRNA synthetase